MAKLLIIKAETEKADVQYIGDVVGVFRDEHEFSPDEMALFNVLVVKGSAEDVVNRLIQMSPVIVSAYRWKSDEEYHFTEGDDEVILDMIEVYQVGNRWYKLVSDFKFPKNIADLTPEEKQFLETIDIMHPSIDAYIKKMIKDYTLLPGNDIEIKELRNSNP